MSPEEADEEVRDETPAASSAMKGCSWIILVTVVIGFVAMPVVLMVVKHYNDENHVNSTLLEYASFTFVAEDSTQFDTLRAYAPNEMGVRGFYLRFSESKLHLISEMRESIAARLCTDGPHDDPLFGTVDYSVWPDRDRRNRPACYLAYKDDRVMTVILNKEGVEFGLTAGGPFYSLPMTREEIISAFGEPSKMKSERRRR